MTSFTSDKHTLTRFLSGEEHKSSKMRHNKMRSKDQVSSDFAEGENMDGYSRTETDQKFEKLVDRMTNGFVGIREDIQGMRQDMVEIKADLKWTSRFSTWTFFCILSIFILAAVKLLFPGIPW